MSKKLRIVMAQLDFLVGDIQGNLQKHIQAALAARDTHKADIIVFSELSLTGYPPDDLLYRPAFIEETNQALHELKAQVENIHCLVGHPHATSKGLFNSCSLIYNGIILARYAKQHLPNYGVFDERRYFLAGESYGVVPVNGIPVGIVICEDLWFASPVQQAATQGARVILSPNASPFEINKDEQRQRILTKRAKTNNVPIIYVNQVGGQDDLIFDGGSMAIDAEGKLMQHAPFCEEALTPVDIDFTAAESKTHAVKFIAPGEDERIYQCLVLGLRDYVLKNNFPGVLIGVSGGIDSALVLALAVDALGKDKVQAVVMPSAYTAAMSLEDATALLKNLGVNHDTVSIEPAFKSFLHSLAPVFGKKQPDITEENLQSRCRGVILMAISNQTGKLVLNCGNRSELAVGYTTLYGDMIGGYSVLKDVPKTLVYRLAKYRNTLSKVIPKRIIERAPSAELAPNQKDEDSLPPYSILDQILALYINQEQSAEQIIAQGFAAELVNKVIKLIRLSEYKRSQAPLGARIDHTAFGRDRRYPVTSGFKK